VSDVAVKSILDFNFDARFIAFVRNPIEQSRAFHRQRINDYDEDVLDFESAWRLQEDRALGRHLPPSCLHPELLQYRATACMGTLIQRFMRLVPADRRHIIVYDDLQARPACVYTEILDFLKLRHDGRNEFPVINQAYEFRLPLAMRMLRRPPLPLLRLASIAKRVSRGQPLGIYRQLHRFMEPRLRRYVVTSPLSKEMHAELVDTFRDEVALLSELLKRDFSCWLAVPP
jgi:hypothetical protein